MFIESLVEIAAKTRLENAEAIDTISFRPHECQKKTTKTLRFEDRHVKKKYKYMLYSFGYNRSIVQCDELLKETLLTPPRCEMRNKVVQKEGYTAKRGHDARSSDYAAHRVQKEWSAIWKFECEVGCREANEAAAHLVVCLHEHVSVYDLEVAILR